MKKRNLWAVGLAGVLAITLASGCNDEGENGGGGGGGGNGGGGNTVAVNVHKWVKVAKNTKFDPAAVKVTKIAISGNGENLYVAGDAAGQLYHVALDTNLANINVDAKWTKFNLADTKLGNTGVFDRKDISSTGGDAIVATLVATDKGAVLATKTAATKAAAALLEVGNFIAAWDSSGAGTFTADHPSKLLNVGVLKNTAGDKEFLYVQDTEDKDSNSTLNSEITATGIKVQLANKFERTVTPFAGDKLFFVNANNKAFIGDKIGLVSVAEGDLGATKSNALIANAAATDWKMATPNNDEVNDMTGHGNNVYVALGDGSAANTGGVAIYKADTNATIKPDTAWDKKKVLTVAFDGTTAWALEATEIVALDLTDTTKVKRGATFAAAAPLVLTSGKLAKGTAAGANFSEDAALPTDKMTDLKFDKNGNMWIATSDAGIIVRKKAESRTLPVAK